MRKNYSVFFLLLAFVLSIGIILNIPNNKGLAKENDFVFNSKSVYLMDYDTKTVVFKKNENEKRPIASMCKIMTLLLSFEHLEKNSIPLSEEITVSENASGMGGSQVFLESNTNYSIDQLLKSITVASANDASVAMAEYISGTEELFVEKMNEKAKSLGMNDTCFVNATGLPKDGQYSTAKDVSIMFCELLKHKDYFNYSTIWTDEIVHPENRVTGIANTNKLVRFYEGCDAGKTGYTSEAGHCLVSSAKRNGLRLVSVIISAPDSKTRFKEASTLFNYGFSNYCCKLIVDNSKPFDIKVKVLGGKESELEVVCEKPIYIFSKKGEKRAFDIDFKPFDSIKAPVNKGDVVGKVFIFDNGNEVANALAIANQSIDKMTYFDTIKNVIDNFGIGN